MKAKRIVPDERRRPNTEERMMNDCSFFVPVRTMGGNITRLHNYWWHRQATDADVLQNEKRNGTTSELLFGSHRSKTPIEKTAAFK